jgi:hypothetical protein
LEDFSSRLSLYNLKEKATGTILVHAMQKCDVVFDTDAKVCGGVVLGIGLVLARQVLYHLSHSTGPFCIGHF